MSARERLRHERRLELLRWAADLGAVSAPALAVRERSGIAAASARLCAAETLRLMASSAPLRSAPRLFVPTRAGLAACGRTGVPPRQTGAARAAHAAACALAAARLEIRYPGHRVLGEPAMRELERAGTLRVSARAHGGPQASHRGDLVLLAPACAPVVVEVELSAKAPARLERICRDWARCRTVAGVIYVAGPGAERAVAAAIDRACAGGRVVAVPLGAL